MAILKKPYTMQEHDDFIMYYGQNCLGKHPYNYEINETETELQALGPTKDELDKQAKEAKIAQIKSELDQLDLKSIRAITAIGSFCRYSLKRIVLSKLFTSIIT